MKSSLIVAIFFGAVIAFVTASSRSAQVENHRSKRAIGKWFSDFFKKFQKKGGRREPMYYSAPSLFSAPSYHAPSTSYGTPPMPQYGAPYEPHTPSYLHISPSSAYGGRYSNGYDSGHGGSSQSGGFNGGSQGHSGGFTGNDHQEHEHSTGYSGKSHPKSHEIHGFGPLKNSDIVKVSSSGSYQPTSHGDHDSSHGHSNNVVKEIHSFQSNHDSFQGPTYGGHSKDTFQSGSFGDSGHNVHGKGNFQQAQDTYTAPSQPVVHNSYESPQPVVQNSYKSPQPSKGFVNEGQSFASPSNDILHSNNQFQQTQVFKAPLSSVSSSGANYGNQQHGGQPTGLFQLLNGRQPGQNIILNANTGAEVKYPSELGPHDPIIEIVFQEGEPAPRHPLPAIDPSLYEPVKDDVEVFFIEYSPEDEIDEFKNLDLTGAEPAILQNLPNELPYELRNHLLNSGVLEDAEIEIVDLQHAINDQSIDLNTRNALQAAYNRPGRDTTVNSNNKQAVDVRVQRLNHESDTPEGAADLLSSLKKYRKGVFAGVVEVNDKATNKYIPVTVDGDKLPLPKNLPLQNKKVDGVLVLASEAKDRRNNVYPRTTVQRGIQHASPSSGSSRTYIPPQKQKRRVDVSWADIDSNGWVPIVKS